MMKRQAPKKKRRTIKKSRGFLKRLIIILLSIGLLFSALGMHNKGNDMDILIKRHTQQTTEQGKKIRELKKQNTQLQEIIIHQHEAYKAESVSFKEPSVKQVSQPEMSVNVKSQVSDNPRIMTVNDVKEEVHSMNEIKEVKPNMVTTVIVTTMVVAKGIASYVFKAPILP